MGKLNTILAQTPEELGALPTWVWPVVGVVLVLGLALLIWRFKPWRRTDRSPLNSAPADAISLSAPDPPRPALADDSQGDSSLDPAGAGRTRELDAGPTLAATVPLDDGAEAGSPTPDAGGQATVGSAALGVGQPTRPTQGPYLESLNHPAGPLFYPLPGSTVSIGRAADNDVVIAGGETVAEHHARIEVDAGHFIVVDGGARGGVFVNGRRTLENVLAHGMRLRFGDAEFQFVLDAAGSGPSQSRS